MIIHARNAILSKKISPRSNLSVPPLRFDAAYALIEDYPDMAFTVNGGISSSSQIREHLERGVRFSLSLDAAVIVADELAQASGVMIGRAAKEKMWRLNSVDEEHFGVGRNSRSRVEIAREFAVYAEDEFYASYVLSLSFSPHPHC